MNYYSVLAVERTATAKQIKKAYLKLAKEYHPDRKRGDERKFKLIQEAYDTLSKTESRKHYNETGAKKARKQTTDDLLIQAFDMLLNVHDFESHNMLDFLEQKLYEDRLNLINAISLAENDVIKLEGYKSRVGYAGKGIDCLTNVIEAKLTVKNDSIRMNNIGLKSLIKIKSELEFYFDNYGDVKALEKQIEGCNCYENAEIDDMEFNDQEMKIKELEKQVKHYKQVAYNWESLHKSDTEYLNGKVDELQRCKEQAEMENWGNINE